MVRSHLRLLAPVPGRHEPCKPALQTRKSCIEQIARTIAAAVEDGRYAPGDKLPSERELADDLRCQPSDDPRRNDRAGIPGPGRSAAGLGRVRQGRSRQISEDASERDVSALELAEARRLFEGEACALAAAIISDEQLALLDGLVADMARRLRPEEFERHELEFHVAIARATGNAAITATVEDLWTLRQQSPAVRLPCGALGPTAAGTLWASIARLPPPCAP